MFRCILVFFVVTAVFGDDHELDHDGPCPKPAVDMTGFSEIEFSGHFFGVCTNYEQVTNKKQCLEELLDQEGETILGKKHYRDPETQAGVEVDTKYVQVVNEPGRFVEYYKNAGGEYEATGWTYSAIKIHDNAALEHVCKEEGDKHFDYYQVSSKTLPVPEDTKKVLMEAFLATGVSNKTPYYYNHENCDYKYD